MVVLEELDANKKGLSEASRNVRQVSRFLDDLMRDATKDEIDAGLPLPSAVRMATAHAHRRQGTAAGAAGRLFFQTRQLSSALPDYLPGHGADNAILSQTLALQALHHDARVTLVSKDINLRIKAAVVGVHAEDYYSDKTIEDADVLYTGLARAAGELLGVARQGHALVEGSRPHVLRDRRARRHRPARQPVRARGRRAKASRPSSGASRRARPRSSWRAISAASATASGA